MPFIPEETLDEIRQRSDLVDIVGSFVELKHRNGDWWGCCPFHKEKSPSFKVNKERQAYYCFGCKAHGNVFDFVKSMVNTDFPGAARWLADRYGIEIPDTYSSINKEEADRLRNAKERRQSLLDLTAGWFHTQLNSPNAEVARNYLASRGIDREAVEKFKLGYSPEGWDTLINWAHSMGFTDEDLAATELVSHNNENGRTYDRFRGRLMFPIWNELGKVVGFSARILDPAAKMAKYVNSPESDFFHKGQVLYGFNFARSELKNFDHVLVCEGQLDVIACHRAGLVNAVAAQGTAFTEEHARLLKKSTSNVRLSFDADTAGYKAAERTIKLLHATGLNVSVVTLPEGEDPDSVFRKGGADALRRIMSVTRPAIHYLFDAACTMNNIKTAEGMSIIVRSVLEAIMPIRDSVIQATYCKWLAETVGLEERVIFNELADMQPRQSTVYKQTQREATPPSFRRMPVYSTPAKDMQVWYMLLDLTLHYKVLAESFAFLDDVVAAIPDTPLGRAVNYVAMYTQQDEWSLLPDILMKMDIFSDPEVARALIASDLKEYVSSAEENIPLQHLKSFNDCATRVRLESVEKQLAEKRAQCNAERNTDLQRQLFDEMNRLTAKKRELLAELRKYSATPKN